MNDELILMFGKSIVSLNRKNQTLSVYHNTQMRYYFVQRKLFKVGHSGNKFLVDAFW